ncbi:MAG TPA: DUF5667 domain-containing protein [Anaerolineae bacterium]|nr:DUF5667 domain-containing protein [Anaerolineae bacterium]
MNLRPHPPVTDFDRVLDFCLDEIRAGRLTPDACLQQFPQLRGQLEPLLKVAAPFAHLPRPAMPSAARAALEQRLRARLVDLPAPRPAPRPSRSSFPRWLPIAAAVSFAILIAGAGTVAAAANSLPGDFLYPVKRLSESVAVQLASEANQADLHLAWAQRRLTEFETLSDRGVVNVTLLDEAVTESQQAILASDALGETQQTAALAQAEAFYTSAISIVSSVRERAPETALAGLDQALDALRVGLASAIDHRPPLPNDEPTPTSTPTPTPTPTPGPSSTSTDLPGEENTPTPGQGTPGRGLTKTPDEAEPTPGIPSPTRTPPGQGTPGGGLTQTPDEGEATPGIPAPTRTPPGQGTPGGGLTQTPPPQDTATSPPAPTATPAPQDTPITEPTRTPPGQGTPGGGLTNTPPGQGTPGGGNPNTPKPTHTPKP